MIWQLHVLLRQPDGLDGEVLTKEIVFMLKLEKGTPYAHLHLASRDEGTSFILHPAYSPRHKYRIPIIV